MLASTSFLFCICGVAFPYQDSDFLAEAQKALSRPSVNLFKIKNEIERNQKENLLPENRPERANPDTVSFNLFNRYARFMNNRRHPDHLVIGFFENGVVQMWGQYTGVSSTLVFTGKWKKSGNKLLLWEKYDDLNIKPLYVFQIHKSEILFESERGDKYQGLASRIFCKAIEKDPESKPIN